MNAKKKMKKKKKTISMPKYIEQDLCIQFFFHSIFSRHWTDNTRAKVRRETTWDKHEKRNNNNNSTRLHCKYFSSASGGHHSIKQTDTVYCRNIHTVSWSKQFLFLQSSVRSIIFFFLSFSEKGLCIYEDLQWLHKYFNSSNNKKKKMCSFFAIVAFFFNFILSFY